MYQGIEFAHTPVNPEITMTMIAHRAGLSVSVVSNALRNRPCCTIETRMVVKRVAYEMGYDFSNLGRRGRRRKQIVIVRV